MNVTMAASIYWQDGYGVVTFSASELSKVTDYVASQQERHRAHQLSPFLETTEMAGSAVDEGCAAATLAAKRQEQPGSPGFAG